MTNELYFDSWQGQNILFSPNAFRPTLGPINPPIQWVMWALSPGTKQPSKEVDQSPPSSAKVKKECSKTFSPPYYFTAHVGAPLPIPLVALSIFAGDKDAAQVRVESS